MARGTSTALATHALGLEQTNLQLLYMYLYEINICRNLYLVTHCVSALSTNHIALFSSFGITAVSFSNERPAQVMSSAYQPITFDHKINNGSRLL